MSYIENFKNKFPGICFHHLDTSYDIENPVQFVTRRLHNTAHDNFTGASKVLIGANELANKTGSHEASALKEQAEALAENAWENVLRTKDALLPVDQKPHQLPETSPLRKI